MLLTLLLGMHTCVPRMHSHASMISSRLLLYIGPQYLPSSRFFASLITFSSLEPSEFSINLRSRSLRLRKFVTECIILFQDHILCSVFLAFAGGPIELTSINPTGNISYCAKTVENHARALAIPILSDTL